MKSNDDESILGFLGTPEDNYIDRYFMATSDMDKPQPATISKAFVPPRGTRVGRYSEIPRNIILYQKLFIRYVGNSVKF